MKKIALLTTGGTIASKVDDNTGKLMAGQQTGEEIFSKCNLSHLKGKIDITVESVYQVPSNQMSFEKLQILLNRINELKNKGFDGFVITHGTDTMEESAYFMSLISSGLEPIVFTGSQVSPTENNTDAFSNLSNAITVAASDFSKGLGTIVVFNDKIFTAQYVTKVHASNIDGFDSPRNGCIGIVDSGKVHYFSRPFHYENYDIMKKFPKVGIFKECIDNDPEIIDYYISNGYEGIVVEGYGRGQTNIDSRDKLIEAIEKGIKVVVTTTCPNGEVAPVYGYIGSFYDLLENGAINGKDYTSKKARIKLMLLLSGDYDLDNIRKEFER